MNKMSRIYTFIFTLLIMSSSFANAASDVRVDGFVIKGLDLFKGKRISVYYVSARPATLETPGQIAKVRKVLKGPLTFTIARNGEVNIPETEVLRDGWTTFNHIIFVVHGQAKHSLRNVDGTFPDILDTENQVPNKSGYDDFLYRKSILYSRGNFSGGKINLF